jgi:hypothetical protein
MIRAGSPGLRIEERWDHLGLRASGSHDAVLEDVFVPDDAVGTLALPDGGPPPREDLQAAWNAALLGTLYTGVGRKGRRNRRQPIPAAAVPPFLPWSMPRYLRGRPGGLVRDCWMASAERFQRARLRA